MNDANKIKLIDLILEKDKELAKDKSTSPKMIGTLNKVQGVGGFKKMEIGTPVFDSGDRYFMMMESLDGKRCLEVSYYKDTLRPVIDFITNNNGPNE